MTDLLLISDVPRLSTIFSRLTDDKTIQLRIATSLEKGGEELAAEKPGIVFVQTHLSGLSADILLKHLKKQLGRKRTKFVLLSNSSQNGAETLNLYQGHLDISQEDEDLLACIKSLTSSLLAKKKKTATEPVVTQPDISIVSSPEASTPLFATPLESPPAISADRQEPTPSEMSKPESAQNEPSLADQGITYAAPRSRLSVYSEFNSSFDTAVSSIPQAEPLAQMPTAHEAAWHRENIEVVKTENTRSKRTTFLLWLAPVIIAVIVVTMLQHRSPKPSGVAVKPETKSSATSPTVATTPAAPKPTDPPAVAVPPSTTAQQTAGPVPSSTPPANSVTVLDAKLGDKAVLSAIAENRGVKEKVGTRPTTLPDFIPRSGQDKSYGTTNPGWERYKGQVTEFKVFREGGGIKAIQIVDRGGKGIPESFMKGVLSQVGNKTSFAKETTEKKEGYEIQRGRVAENLSVVMYRDEDGGRLRAFVLTWQ